VPGPGRATLRSHRRSRHQLPERQADRLGDPTQGLDRGIRRPLLEALPALEVDTGARGAAVLRLAGLQTQGPDAVRTPDRGCAADMGAVESISCLLQ
jgi:hypothetical protein